MHGGFESGTVVREGKNYIYAVDCEIGSTAMMCQESETASLAHFIISS